MRRWALLITAAILLSSCSKPKPEDKVVGTWLGNPPIPKSLAGDPNFSALNDMMKDSVQLELKGDHTYTLRTWTRKRGKWKLAQRLVQFEETGSSSDFPFPVDFEFGKPTSQGTRTYSAVLASDGKTLTLMLGKMGDIDFHR
ncbi:MAG TPA: hypothetical protein VHE55_17985 [Fimbriimonadaceae bacterium]|nr:hypothetical protein [Fimbriimonadaceae bacterium]